MGQQQATPADAAGPRCQFCHAVLSSACTAASLERNLVRNGLLNEPLAVEAFSRVDRADFVPTAALEARIEYVDGAIALGDSGAQISAPHVHAAALDLIAVGMDVPPPPGGWSVLDVGSGSGVMCCLLAHLVELTGAPAAAPGRVVAVEHVAALEEQARRNVAKHHERLLQEHGGLLTLRCADGRRLATEVPGEHQYDRIHVGGAVEQVPAWLTDLLKPGGRAVVPVGPTDAPQQLCTVDKHPQTGELEVTEHRRVLFVPITTASHQQERAEEWDTIAQRCLDNAAEVAAQDAEAALASKGQLPLDCDCFLLHNYYVSTVGDAVPVYRHFSFLNEGHFRRENADFMKEVGPAVGDQVVASLEEQKARRLVMDSAAQQRKKDIAAVYPDKQDPDCYHLSHVVKLLHPEFVQLVEQARALVTELTTDEIENGEGAEALLSCCECLHEVAPGLYSFPVFREELCVRLKREIQDVFQDRCKDLLTRPNSMNNNGVLLDEAGFTPGFTDPLMTDFIRPLATLLFPNDGGGSLDNHRCFTVHYAAHEEGVDRELKQHYDNAEVTLNVSLLHSSPACTDAASTPLPDATGAGDLLFFGHKNLNLPRRLVRVRHRPGMGVLHNGAERHCAEPMENGERTNLIVWCRSTRWRRQNGCAMCGFTTGLKY